MDQTIDTAPTETASTETASTENASTETAQRQSGADARGRLVLAARRVSLRLGRAAALLALPILAVAAGPAALRDAAVELGLAPSFHGAAAASDIEPCSQGVDSARCVVVLVDHLRRLSFRDEVQTVLVGNPAIADVAMISSTEAVISARTVGSTNMIFLNERGLAISDFEVLVRESESQRVVLRRGPNAVELYQCAPRCERTLTQLDSEGPHAELAGTIGREIGLTAGAVDSAASAGGAEEDAAE